LAATNEQKLRGRDPGSGSPKRLDRAESPTKGRVRDLAGKIESNPNSRRGSQESLTRPGSAGGASSAAAPVNVPEQTRPSQQHLDSFRPALPGGWNSYTTNDYTPTRGDTGRDGPVMFPAYDDQPGDAARPDLPSNSSTNTGGRPRAPSNLTGPSVNPSFLSSQSTPITTVSRPRQVSEVDNGVNTDMEDTDIEPTTQKKALEASPGLTSPTSPQVSITDRSLAADRIRNQPTMGKMASEAVADPFAAASAAGTALANAFSDMTGFGHGDGQQDEPGREVRQPPGPRGRHEWSVSNRFGDIMYNPDLKRPQLPVSSDSSSSVLPTPMSMDDREPELTPIAPLRKRDSAIPSAFGKGNLPESSNASTPVSFNPINTPAASRPQPLSASDNENNRPSSMSMSVSTIGATSNDASPMEESDRLRRDIVRQLDPEQDGMMGSPRLGMNAVDSATGGVGQQMMQNTPTPTSRTGTRAAPAPNAGRTGNTTTPKQNSRPQSIALTPAVRTNTSRPTSREGTGEMSAGVGMLGSAEHGRGGLRPETTSGPGPGAVKEHNRGASGQSSSRIKMSVNLAR